MCTACVHTALTLNTLPLGWQLTKQLQVSAEVPHRLPRPQRFQRAPRSVGATLCCPLTMNNPFFPLSQSSMT